MPRSHNSNPDRKNWCFTAFAYDEQPIQDVCDLVEEALKDDRLIQYFVIGKEIAPTTGRPHLQGYVQFNRAKYLSWLTRTYEMAAFHWEPQMARINSKASEYCKKDHEFVEWGTFVESGFSSDYNDVVREFMDGNIQLVEIARRYPHIYLQYGRRFRDMEQLRDRARRRVTEVAHCINRREFEVRIGQEFDPEHDFVYRKSWVGYHGQSRVYWILGFEDDSIDIDAAVHNGIVHNGCEGILFNPAYVIPVSLNLQ